ncbi:MAG: FimB/Mfa2 family fimbrial subunit [Dysgonomonas sp.]
MDKKSGQPVYSQEATQNIDKVDIYVFKDDAGTYKWVKTYTTTWTSGTASKTYTVPDNDKLAAGNYRFIAVGINTSGSYTIAATTSTTYSQLYAEIATSGDEYEIFAGNNAAVIGAAQEAQVGIDMTRKVAGFLGYFGNIPADIDGTAVKYLRLKIDKANKAVSLSDGLGNTSASGYNLFEIDLSGQTVTNGLYDGNEIASVTKLPFSQLAGGYLIPVTGVQLTVGLYASDGEPLRTWKVVNGSNQSQYDLVANNLYSLGQKMKAGDTTGGTGDPNDPLADSFMDLQKDQDIVITINKDWETIHSLDIEEE